MKKKTWAKLKAGVVLAVSISASTVTEKVIGAHIPEQDKLVGKVVTKLGSYGIGLAVSSAASKAMEAEADTVEQLLEGLGVLEDDGPTEVPLVDVDKIGGTE